MNIKSTYDLKDTIRVESTIEIDAAFSDTDNLFSPDTVEITITAPDDSEVVGDAEMTEHDTGEFFYEWDTSNLSGGDYLVEVYAEKADGVKALDDFYIRLE